VPERAPPRFGQMLVAALEAAYATLGQSFRSHLTEWPGAPAEGTAAPLRAYPRTSRWMGHRAKSCPNVA